MQNRRVEGKLAGLMDTEGSLVEQAECFTDFVARLRSQDAIAEKQLVEVFGPVIFRAIGHRLHALGLARAVDPEDVAQEVFGKFFAKVPNTFQLANPTALARLLVKMTRAEMVNAHRRFHAVRRGGENRGAEPAPQEDMVSAADGPDHDLLEQEQLEEIHRCMSEPEWDLALAHFAGRSWKELATEFGHGPEALRKKLNRILERVRQIVST
jgi:RNA polymerase sigma factor (sigma-70 family)